MVPSLMRMFWSFVVPHSSDYVCAVMLLRFFAIFVDTWLSAVRVEITSASGSLLYSRLWFFCLPFDFHLSAFEVKRRQPIWRSVFFTRWLPHADNSASFRRPVVHKLDSLDNVLLFINYEHTTWPRRWWAADRVRQFNVMFRTIEEI